MTQLPILRVVDVDAEIDALAARYKGAGGIGIDLLNSLGLQADHLLKRLPPAARDGLQDATEAALRQAMKAAHKSRDVVPDQASWLNAAVSAAMGAAGGFGGLPTALAELPVTTTLLLRGSGWSRESWVPLLCEQCDCRGRVAVSGGHESFRVNTREPRTAGTAVAP